MGVTYLFTEGRFKITWKNFSRISNKAASVTAGFGSKPTAGFGFESTAWLPTTPVPNSFELKDPFVATLLFFRNAAEKPDAHT